MKHLLVTIQNDGRFVQLEAELTVKDARSVDGTQRLSLKASFGDFVKSTIEKPAGHCVTHTYRGQRKVLTCCDNHFVVC